MTGIQVSRAKSSTTLVLRSLLYHSVSTLNSALSPHHVLPFNCLIGFCPPLNQLAVIFTFGLSEIAGSSNFLILEHVRDGC